MYLLIDLRFKIRNILTYILNLKLTLLLECLTAACKALSLANGKGKGTNGLEIGSSD